MSLVKAGVLPPHPHSLVVAARNRKALAAAALTSDVQVEAKEDEEAVEGNVENDEHMQTQDNDQLVQNEENKDSKKLDEDKKDP